MHQQLRRQELQSRHNAQPRVMPHHQRQTKLRSGWGWLVLKVDLDPVIDLIRMAASEDFNTLRHMHALHVEEIPPLSVHKPLAAQRTVGVQQRRKHARDVMQLNSNVPFAFLLHGRGSGRSIEVVAQFQREIAFDIPHQLARQSAGTHHLLYLHSTIQYNFDASCTATVILTAQTSTAGVPFRPEFNVAYILHNLISNLCLHARRTPENLTPAITERAAIIRRDANAFCKG